MTHVMQITQPAVLMLPKVTMTTPVPVKTATKATTAKLQKPAVLYKTQPTPTTATVLYTARRTRGPLVEPQEVAHARVNKMARVIIYTQVVVVQTNTMAVMG